MGCAFSHIKIIYVLVCKRRDGSPDRWIREDKRRLISECSEVHENFNPRYKTMPQARIDEEVLHGLVRNQSSHRIVRTSAKSAHDEMHRQATSVLFRGPIPSPEFLGASSDFLESWNTENNEKRGINFHCFLESHEVKSEEEDLGEFSALSFQRTREKRKTKASRFGRKFVEIHDVTDTASWCKYTEL